ncbi:MAG TPA: C40 family peptidase, partial [Ignavibacteriaceae bacterium]|nr:C40 family peptidase [Ignavibacteriaceae bacterium]
AFTQNLYRDILSINLLRSARLQFTQGQSVSNKQDLQFGDLVFFNTRQRVRPGHVGIYIGDKLFAHASTAKGVTISSMDLDYYSQRFMGGRRIDSHGLTEKTQ